MNAKFFGFAGLVGMLVAGCVKNARIQENECIITLKPSNITYENIKIFDSVLVNNALEKKNYPKIVDNWFYFVASSGPKLYPLESEANEVANTNAKKLVERFLLTNAEFYPIERELYTFYSKHGSFYLSNVVYRIRLEDINKKSQKKIIELYVRER